MFEVNRISIDFGGLKALRNVSLKVDEGKIFSIIGPNGAGKTTLFNIITGFLTPNNGQVIFDGEEITGLPANRIAQKGIVRTFQKTEVFPELTVLDCVKTGFLCNTSFSVFDIFLRPKKTREYEKMAFDGSWGLLRFVGLENNANTLALHLPYGKQRILEIVVGLAAKPRMLILDEPASGMNSEETSRMIDLIYKLRDQNITILVVEHNMNVVMDISDHIIVLNHGEKIAEGNSAYISQHPDVIKAYLGREWRNAQD
jgi:branched-chain amino acid transport system ATP-binding protein